MLSFFDLLALLLLFLLGWYLVSSLKVRERANQVAAVYCRKKGLQFLDGSVGFGTLSLVRDSGKLKLRRVYVFSYSKHSVERLSGIIIFVGGVYQSLVLLDETEKVD